MNSDWIWHFLDISSDSGVDIGEISGRVAFVPRGGFDEVHGGLRKIIEGKPNHRRVLSICTRSAQAAWESKILAILVFFGHDSTGRKAPVPS